MLKRLDPFAILSVIVPLGIYLLTLAPTVTFFDSGEFLTAIHSLGTAHSPGYPLFINYAKPFTFLPFGSVAFRVNFATAVSAAIACYGVYLLACTLLAGAMANRDERLSVFVIKAVSLCAAFTFAFTPRLWLQSNHDKPYPLVSFIAAMVFYLILRWREEYRAGEERPHYVYLGAFLCGLAFGAHQTIVLMLPSYAFLIISMDRRMVWRIKEIILAVAFAVLGFAAHLHMIVRATRTPLLNWGDPKTLEQFLWNLLRRGYPVEKPERGLGLLWEQIKAFHLASEFTWVGVVLLVVGLLAFSRKKWAEVAAYLIGIVFFLLVIVGYFNTPQEMIFLTEEFFTPLYLLSAVFIALGLFTIVRFLVMNRPPETLATLPAKAVMVVILAALPASVCAINYVENDQHENFIAYDYATNSLRTLPQGAIMFTWGDSGAFPLWYLQGVERMREDVDLLHTPHLVFAWYLDGFPKIFANSILRTVPSEAISSEQALMIAISQEMPRRPVFIDFSTRYSVSFPDYRLQQQGICYQLEPLTGSALRPPDLAIWSLYNSRGLSGGEMFFRDLDTSKAILIYGSSYLESGETLLRIGHQKEGVAALRMAEKISPEMRFQAEQTLSNYGVR
jgi:transmembrane protein TMEM260 (protein O-mannosyltransferase)